MEWIILKTLIRNVNSYQMNRDLIGYSFEVVSEPITRDKAIEFAEATKDNNPIYHKSDFVPPFFVNKLIFPMMKKVFCHNELNMNLLRMVHAQQEMILHQPIKVGDQLKIRIEIADIYDTAVGEMVEVAGKAFKNNELVMEGISGLMVRGKTNKSKKRSVENKSLQEAFRFDIQTEDGQQLKYAKISGDNNFIHTNNVLAKMAGLPRTIMHGACVIAMICAALIEKKIDYDISRLESIRGQFRKPTIPGEKLTLIGYDSQNSYEIHFDVLNASGNAVFRNGMFKFRR